MTKQKSQKANDSAAKKRKSTSSPNTLKNDKSGQACWCGKPSNVYEIECYMCDSFTHYECAGFGNSIKLLTDCLRDENSVYVCKTCRPKLSNDQIDELREIGPIYAHGDGEVNASGGDVDYGKMVKAATEAAIKAVLEYMDEKLEERFEKAHKKDNLVIVGLPDLEKTEADQNRADRKAVGEICDTLDIPRAAIASTFREGKETGKRILKVCFGDRMVSERRTFLSKATPLIRDRPECNGRSFKAFVRRDLTAKERETDYKLRCELRSARALHPDKYLKIYQGKIVEAGKPHGYQPPAAPTGNDDSMEN